MQQSRYSKGQRKAPAFTIKTIWGIAKGAELQLKDEDLYSIIYRETGKDSIRKLTQREINKVCSVLSEMKDNVLGKTKVNNKRTDIGGNKLTKEQRQKIYMLTEELGWNNNNARINGFVKKMFKVERLEWLDNDQCSKLIEILKDMILREELKNEKA